MGNPRRFLGSGDVVQDGSVTLPPRCAVEVTFRCHQQRFLLRPDAEANDILLGCLGRAYQRYPGLNLHVISVLSNHGCFLASPESSFVLSSFMRDFLSTLGKRINLHRDRDGVVFERRYRAIPVLDEDAMEDRFRYVLTQGTKENLVASARDWPGVQSARALLGGPPLVGRWRDRSAELRLRRQRDRKLERAAARGQSPSLKQSRKVCREYPIELVPMAHWLNLKPGQRRAQVASMLTQDDAAAGDRHERDQSSPLGVRAILKTDPKSRPVKSAKSSAPFCHGRSGAARRAFRRLYNVFVDLLVQSRERLKTHLEGLGVPLGGTLGAVCHQIGPMPGNQLELLANAPSVGPPGRAIPQAR